MEVKGTLFRFRTSKLKICFQLKMLSTNLSTYKRLLLCGCSILILFYLVIHFYDNLEIGTGNKYFRNTSSSCSCEEKQKIRNVSSDEGQGGKPNNVTGQNSNETIETTPFLKMIQGFPWDDVIKSIRANNLTKFTNLGAQLLRELTPFLTKEPVSPINETCTPPPLGYLNSSACEKRAKPRKVGVLLQLGFDADTLEMHFHELDAVVDYFFILESIRSHNIGLQKPLMWEALQKQSRFAKFVPKVIHFILDDSDVTPLLPSVRHNVQLKKKHFFNIEIFQEQTRWKKFLAWNNSTHYFGNEDILGFGDADEIPYRNVVNYLKNCKMPSDPVDVGTHFAFGKVDQIFRSDFPVKGYPFAFGDPTFWTLATAEKVYYSNGFTPNRLRGLSGSFLLGGVHMTHYGYLPFQITEYFTASETLVKNTLAVISKLKTLSERNFEEIERKMGAVPVAYRRRVISLNKYKSNNPARYETIVKLPWFYLCNKMRYPLWEGKHDPRLD